MTALFASSMQPWQPSPSLDGIFHLEDVRSPTGPSNRHLQGQNQQIKQLATIQSTAEKRVSAD